MSAQEAFVQNVNGRNWVAAADQLNGSAMYDILALIVALGPNGSISVNNISGVLRKRGWFGAAQRIEWAGEVVQSRRILNPPPGLPADQVADARKFLERPSAKARSFDIVMSSPFRSGWKGGFGGPNMGGHKSPDWFIQYGMDLGVNEGTEVLAAFSGHVTKFQPHTPSKDTSKVYGAQLFLRSDNNMMGGFYTHITGGPSFGIGQRITKGDHVGNTLRDHLHLALVEIIGGAPGGRYAGVDLYQHFLRVRDASTILTVTFKQDGSPPMVT